MPKMEGWGDYESFSDYTVLYDQGIFFPLVAVKLIQANLVTYYVNANLSLAEPNQASRSPTGY